MIQYIVSCTYSCYTDCAKVVSVKETSVILIDWSSVEAQFWYIGPGWDVQLTIWETYSHIIILCELEEHINSDKWKMETQFWYVGAGWDVQLTIWETYSHICNIYIILSELEEYIKWKTEAQFWYIEPSWDVQLRIWRIDENYILTCNISLFCMSSNKS